MVSSFKAKIAIIGSGYMAEEHIRALCDIENVEIVAVCSRSSSNASRLSNKYNISSSFTSISKMYEKLQPHGVIIAVSELSIKSVLRESVSFPWSILTEKPVGYNLIEAFDIYNSVSSLNSSIFVGFNRRHYSSTRSVLKHLASSSSPRVVTVTDQEDPQQALLDDKPKIAVDNWMYCNSIHLLTIFRFSVEVNF